MTTTPHLVKPGTQVNTTDGSTAQFDSEITPLQDGGYVVVWTDLSHTYNPQGERHCRPALRFRRQQNRRRSGEVARHSACSRTGTSPRPAVTTLANGDIAVAYVDLFSGNSDITVHIFDPSLHFVRTDLIDDRAEPDVPPVADRARRRQLCRLLHPRTGTNTEVVARTVSATGG